MTPPIFERAIRGPHWIPASVMVAGFYASVLLAQALRDPDSGIAMGEARVLAFGSLALLVVWAIAREDFGWDVFTVAALALYIPGMAYDLFGAPDMWVASVLFPIGLAYAVWRDRVGEIPNVDPPTAHDA